MYRPARNDGGIKYNPMINVPIWKGQQNHIRILSADKSRYSTVQFSNREFINLCRWYLQKLIMTHTKDLERNLCLSSCRIK